jgi:methyl-accepting chemotaxis protein
MEQVSEAAQALTEIVMKLQNDIAKFKLWVKYKVLFKAR